MKPYKSSEMFEIMDALTSHITTSDNASRLEPGNEERNIPFFDQHWIECFGLYSDAELTPATFEEQKRFIDLNPKLKIVAVNNVYRISIKPAIDDKLMPAVGIVLSLLDSAETTVSATLTSAHIGQEMKDVDVQVKFHI